MRVYLDSNLVIYLVEKSPTWGERAEQYLTPRLQAGDQLIVSDLNLVECLSTPMRDNDQLILKAYDSFWKMTVAEVVPLTKEVCLRAAAIRGHFRFKTPDSIHLAAAVENGCDVFLTNDHQLQRFNDIAVELLT